MSAVIEVASTGRAKCRACGHAIAKGEQRLGDKLPNPFAEGETTYWFHLECGAYRRAEAFSAALEASDVSVPNREELLVVAGLGVAHPRLCRVAAVQRAPSGRARCRQCREPIAKDGWRLSLDIFQEGRFDPIGFVHLGCQRDYFGTGDSRRHVLRAAVDISTSEREELLSALSALEIT